MKLWAILLIAACFISFSSAICTDGQIDINTASLEELDKLYGIGPAKAQAIIDARPFDSIDDLIRTNGIGEITLENIKNQGLACLPDNNLDEDDINNESIDDEYQERKEETLSEEEEEKEVEIKEKEETTSLETNEKTTSSTKKDSIPLRKQEIILNPQPPKNIKTKENFKLQENQKYSVYSLIIFCIFLGFLFFLDKKKKRKQNEFRNSKDKSNDYY